jgi:hypothetical protein
MNIVWQPEDSLREKKVENDLKDLLKTLVSFANSVAPGDVAKIFIGERDDGTVQGVTSVDNIQKSVTKEAEKIYPAIYYRTEVYERDGKHCIRVEIKHNGLAPHFGGAAWIRQGPLSVLATGELYQQLVDLRSSKVQQLAKWLGKSITVSWANMGIGIIGPNWGGYPCELVGVTGSFSTFKKAGTQKQQSEPNDWLTLSWDDQRNCLQIYIDPHMKSRPPYDW